MSPLNRNSGLFLIVGLLIGLFIGGLLFLLLTKPFFKRNELIIDHFGNNVTPIEQQVIIFCHQSQSSSDLYGTKIDINTASLKELDTLPGIGEVKSREIIEFRQRYGNFHSINELLYVKGISESLFQRFCNLVIVNP